MGGGGGSGGGGGPYSRIPTKSKEERDAAFESAEDEVRSSKARNVFISFHIEDEDQVRLLRHQAKDNQFGLHFRDYSVKAPFDERWKSQCREKLELTSALICMIGKDTWKREAVDWEIREATRQGKRVIGVRIYRDQNHKIPQALKDVDAPIVDWNLARISQLLEK